MGFFSSKKEVRLEDFCRNFYDKLTSSPIMKGLKIEELAKKTKEKIIEVDSAFQDVDLQKLTHELEVMSFELFALAWTHSFGGELVFEQSMFTNKYLQEKEKGDIWAEMKEYNRAIGSSVTYGLGDIKYSWSITATGKFSDKLRKIAQDNGLAPSDYDAENIYRPTQRQFSEKAWETGATGFGLSLALCQRLGLAEGDHEKHFGLFGFDNSVINFGINTDARMLLNTAIVILYEGAKESLDNIKIIK